MEKEEMKQETETEENVLNGDTIEIEEKNLLDDSVEATEEGGSSDNELQEIHDEHSGIDYRVPSGFYVDEETGQIFYETENGLVRLSHVPTLIIGIIRNLDDGTEKVKLQLEKRRRS